ncbi:hypothetical protein KSP40_PGU009395 [Platanthera guangdongensis]|uniref:Uncharacterized protein n=1 Tax=Platanthera guangdongensis TaxID=2320717 RepID=A0ABR2LGA2_9ASPA
MEALGGSDPDLLSFLSSSLPESDLHKAQILLASREKSLKAEMECNFLDELSLKEVEKIEAEHRCDILEKRAHALNARCNDLEDRVQNGVEIGRSLEEVMKRCDCLERSMEELQKEVLEWRKKHEELAISVLELMKENSRLRILSEQNHKPTESKSIPGVVICSNVDFKDGKEGKMDSLSIPTPKKKSRLTKVSSDIEGEVILGRIPTGMLSKRRRIEKTEWDNGGFDCSGVLNSSSCQGKQGDMDRVKRLLFPLPECRESEICVRSPMESSFGDEYPLRNIKRTSSTPEAAKKMVVISDSDDDHGEEDSGPESEGSSLGGFIVGESECSQRNHTSSGATDEESACGEVECTADKELDSVLSKISGKREDGNKWEYEADLLASFAKDPKLCMEAVCTLYRMQTAEEKLVKGTILLNNRGFSQCDAHR